MQLETNKSRMYINEGATAVVVDVASLNVRLLIVSLLLNTHSHTSGLGIQSYHLPGRVDGGLQYKYCSAQQS